ncbi:MULTISPECIES: 2-dehydro-3-deoxygalactonokinase [Sphingobium]|uniref:2-dehydro-3-deoxygalactonokinase n=1 Tax=Sphingobium tyrosinilyticum TaxID=2715436 RepID=A0ABV9F0E5_9SPHN|nr:2-dehydro-3-deoxygalactonokinase [Sphingobium sp. EP60837]ANI78521.1 2-dehydro-3-deoxygalactonokinase [Sphingobium sp. EP60837]
MSGYDVVGDWGTSRLRLFRIEQGEVIARLEGPGIAAVGANAEAAFADSIAPWLDGGMPGSIRLCGMAGARDGWVEAPYADCPATSSDWRSAAARFDWRGVPVTILAGLACTSSDGVPDVMRGEETQLFGAINRHPHLADGRQLIVLPGTHNKWTLVEDGRILTFRTVPTGELYALLHGQSTLGAKSKPHNPAEEGDGFAEGLGRAGQGGLLTSLFAARSMRLRAGRSSDWAAAYLSGLLIGCEIAEVTAMLGEAGNITLIGDQRLCTHYAQALEAQGLTTHMLDGDDCVLAGLTLPENDA